MTRRAAKRRVARDAGVPYYGADFAPVRGHCPRPIRGGTCPSRFGIVRVSIDLTSRVTIDKLATLDCAVCGHVWRRIRPPLSVTSSAGYQSVRLTLILPAADRVNYLRAKRKRVTADGSVAFANATLPDYMAAIEDWRGRNATLRATRERAAARKAESDREGVARMTALLAGIHAREAERAAEESAASAREAAYGA